MSKLKKVRSCLKKREENIHILISIPHIVEWVIKKRIQCETYNSQFRQLSHHLFKAKTFQKHIMLVKKLITAFKYNYIKDYNIKKLKISLTRMG